MELEAWQPWYKKIVKKLELDARTDATAPQIFEQILAHAKIEKLAELVKGKECIIFGAGPSLDEDLEKISTGGKTLITADGATSAVIKYHTPDIIVTDLDGKIDDQLEAWKQGAWLVIHAHGDNIGKIRETVPQVKKRIIGTTQLEPFGKLYNFGGFTDGDRAAFMAHELGASKIILAGMDLGKEIGQWSGEKDEKKKIAKLEICGELLTWLSRDLGANIVNLTSGGEDIPGIERD